MNSSRNILCRNAFYPSPVMDIRQTSYLVWPCLQLILSLFLLGKQPYKPYSLPRLRDVQSVDIFELVSSNSTKAVPSFLDYLSLVLRSLAFSLHFVLSFCLVKFWHHECFNRRGMHKSCPLFLAGIKQFTNT
jgi:hypothetical protein